MKFLIILISILLFNNCTEKSSDMKIYFYKKGDRFTLNNSKLNIKNIENLLYSLIYSTDDIIRLYMHEERYETLKNEEMCAEFIFSKEIKLNTSKLGELNFDRILIPFTGDFAGNENSSNCILFIGVDKYFPEPLGSSLGYPEVLKIKSELEKAIK